MKVLKILAIVFGAIALLTGVGMYLGSTAVDKGGEALNTQMTQQGFLGPVEGVVKAVEQSVYTVDFTDQQGTPRTGKGAAASAKPEIGDTVELYYYKDSPETILIADLDLGSVRSVLRTGGLITAGIGLALLIAGILGLLLGKKPPAVAPYPAQSYPPQPQYPQQQYPPQQYPQGPPQQYPPVPPQQQYPPQGQAPYPPQQYPPVPPQQYPSQQYPPQQYPPQQYPPQQYPPAPPQR
jgi:hypothetical protein